MRELAHDELYAACFGSSESSDGESGTDELCSTCAKGLPGKAWRKENYGQFTKLYHGLICSSCRSALDAEPGFTRPRHQILTVGNEELLVHFPEPASGQLI